MRSTIQVDGRDRSIVTVRPTVSTGSLAPAVLVFHGSGQTADGIRKFADRAASGDVRAGSLGIDCAGFDAAQAAAGAE